MRFRTIKSWDMSQDLSGLLFFAQKMEELLFDYSLDSYKAPTLNAPFLAKEAITLIEEIENQTIDPNNLVHVLEELDFSIKNDFVAKQLISLPSSKYFDCSSPQQNISETKLKLEILFHELYPVRYLDKIFEILKPTIISKEKAKIDFLARSLSSQLINIGSSKGHLYNVVTQFFFYGSPINIDSIDEFIEKIKPYSHNFTAHFKVSGLINDVSKSLEKFDLEISDSLAEPVLRFSKEKNFTLSKDEKYVTVTKIRASDALSAMQEAEERLSKISDLFLMYYHKQKIEWSDNAIMQQCCTDEIRMANRSKSPIEKGFDLKPKAASKSLTYLLENMGFSRTDGGFKQFNRLVDLHGMSVSTNIVENQLLNLWTCIETLAPSNLRISKIKNINNSIIPFIMLNYIRRLIERFGYDFFIWNPKKARSIIKQIPNSKGLNYHQKCLKLLSLDDNELLRKDLYKELGDFELLRFRAFKLHEIFSNPRKLQDFINNHERRVSWQIRRIYRTRNLITHSGKTPTYINSLVENAHDYFDQVFNIICMLSCKDLKFTSFEQAFQYAEMQYEDLQTFLRKEEKIEDTNVMRLYWNY